MSEQLLGVFAYIPFLGRVECADQTFRVLSRDADLLVCALEDKHYVIQQPMIKRTFTSCHEVRTVEKRDVERVWQGMKKHCMTKEEAVRAEHRWQSGQGWRSPEAVWLAMAEIVRAVIEDETRSEQARFYFNDEMKLAEAATNTSTATANVTQDEADDQPGAVNREL